MALGSSFSVTPAGMEEQAQRAKKRIPTQQALQTLSLQLPKTLGAEGLAPSGRTVGAYTPGDKFATAGGDTGAAAQMARMMRKMSGYKPGASAPTGPRFSQGTTGTTTTPKPAAPPPVKPPLSLKPPAAKPPAAKPPKGFGGGSNEAPAYEVPEPGEPGYVPPGGIKPANPSQIGGGYVDSTPNPPAQMAPPPAPVAAPPPTAYNDANGGGSGGYYWDSSQGRYVSPSEGSTIQQNQTFRSGGRY